jgi:hypothetical protein
MPPKLAALESFFPKMGRYGRKILGVYTVVPNAGHPRTRIPSFFIKITECHEW